MNFTWPQSKKLNLSEFLGYSAFHLSLIFMYYLLRKLNKCVNNDQFCLYNCTYIRQRDDRGHFEYKIDRQSCSSKSSEIYGPEQEMWIFNGPPIKEFNPEKSKILKPFSTLLCSSNNVAHSGYVKMSTISCVRLHILISQIVHESA